MRESPMGMSKTDIGTTILSIVATLAVWEVLIRIFHVPGFILPAPSAIVLEAVTRYQLYLYHSWITFYEMVVGFLLAAAVGVFLAVVIVYSRIIRNMIYPQIVVLQIVPKVAIAPLLLIWAGYGLTSKVLLALLVSFFPIVVNMVTGLVAIEEELLDLCRILHSGRSVIFQSEASECAAISFRQFEGCKHPLCDRRSHRRVRRRQRRAWPPHHHRQY